MFAIVKDSLYGVFLGDYSIARTIVRWGEVLYRFHSPIFTGIRRIAAGDDDFILVVVEVDEHHVDTKDDHDDGVVDAEADRGEDYIRPRTCG